MRVEHEISLTEYVDRGRATLRVRSITYRQIRSKYQLRDELDAGTRAMRLVDRINELMQEIDGPRQLALFEASR